MVVCPLHKKIEGVQMLELITTNVVSTLFSVPVQPAVEALEAVLTDRRAFAYAKEQLRSKYESRIRPASYEHVVDHLRITRQDLVDYFLSTDTPTKSGLDEHLLARLAERVTGWTSNTPSPKLLSELLRDFYSAYERYFFTCDPLLSTFSLVTYSAEARRLLLEIQNQISALARRREEPQRRTSVFDDVLLLLKATGTPFDVIESSTGFLDLRIVEPQSLVSICHLLSVTRQRPTPKDIDRLSIRAARASERFSHVFAVSQITPTVRTQRFAQDKGVRCISVDELRSMVSAKVSPATLLIGRVAAESLARTLNIDKVFIPPDAVPTRPGDEMEETYYTVRENVDDLIDGFLQNRTTRLLALLGDYGSGKSAVAAHTLHRFSKEATTTVAAYVPLSQLDHADHLIDMTRRADNALRALYPHAQQRLVILDGLDEMKDAMAPASRKQNMLRLLDATTKTDKVLVTVRSSYFRGLEDFWRLFSRDQDQQLWDKLARHIPEGSARPRVDGAILREFDSAKIEAYLRQLATTEGRPSSFADEFLESMRDSDLDGVYQRLARSPLYLFLLANTVPWKDSSVASLADVIRLFIRYWLERDISKGPSRWLLSTEDRSEFIGSLAWWMFQRRRPVITYPEFDDFVASYFRVDRNSEDARVIGMDLHTTGVFSSIGRSLFFAMPIFGHYYVASRFNDGFAMDDWPTRLPTAADAKLWIGLMATHGPRFSFDKPSEIADPWMKTMGLDDDPCERFTYDLTGIVYGDRTPAQVFERLNGDAPEHRREDTYRRVRAVLKAAIEGRAGEDAVAGQVVRVRIVNKLGLHARACAKFVHASAATIPGRMEVAKGGERVDGKSILGMLLLAAGRGSIIECRFHECEPSKIDHFLDLIDSHASNDGTDVWDAMFHEIE